MVFQNKDLWKNPSLPSPHAEGLVAQVVPALAHVVQTSPEQSTVLRVPKRGHNPLPILIQSVIQLCVAVNLCLKVLWYETHTVRVSGQSKHSKFCLSTHFIFLVIAAIFQEFTFFTAGVRSNGIRF